MDNPLSAIVGGGLIGILTPALFQCFVEILRGKAGAEAWGIGIWFPLVLAFVGFAPFSQAFGWLFTLTVTCIFCFMQPWRTL